ncbi:MAG: undecaprenyldiphospho-muramoylpentapeptide beta-N-acetylglucosaminyltransferase [Candidatus Krumholzibacteriia bacterium]
MIAGGGTGGHVYPGIAIYNALRRAGGPVEVLFVGAKAGVESRIFEELNLPYILLSGRGVRGSSLLRKLASPFLLAAGIVAGIRAVASFNPDVVIGTGGYASVATVAAAVVCRRRRVLQEQNSVPGMANRVLSRFAHLVLLSYQESRVFFGGLKRYAVVGNPLRVEPGGDRAAALRFFGLRGDLSTVLVFGGSRGAQSINAAARSAVRAILKGRDVQFVLLTGEADFEAVSRDLADVGDYVRVYPFLNEIQHAYNAADIAVSRAGASAVFELAAFGVPAVFIPYPYAADDHQQRNVATLENMGAAVVIDNETLDGKGLETIILSLLDDGERRAGMSARLREWSRAGAADLAARHVIDVVESRRQEQRVVLRPRGVRG